MSGHFDMVRASFAAYEDGDFDALLEMMHPDLEVQDWPEGPDSRTFRGMDGLMQARAHWAEAWESVRGEPTRLVEAGDSVFAFIEITAKGRGSSIEIKLETFGVYSFRDAKVWRVQYFTNREAALAAAGLTEEQIGQEAT